MKLKNIICIILSMSLMNACNNTSQNSITETPEITDSQITNSKNEDIIITIPSNDYMMEYAEEFNAENNGYRVVFKDYSNFYDSSFNDESGLSTPEAFFGIDENICLDFLKGDVLDVIPDCVFFNKGKYDALESKGAFIDLNTFMENDDDVNMNTLSDNIINLHKRDDKLYSLPLFYSIDTLMGYSKYVGTKENWTLDDLIQKWNLMPEGATFNGQDTKEYVYMCILRGNVNSFIDISSKTTSFDSPDFLRILEFVNSFSDPLPYKTDEGYSKPTFLIPVQIYNFDNYHDTLWNAQNDDVTFVGYPTSNNNGAYINTENMRVSISSLSSPEVQKGAWQFIKHFAEYNYQYENSENSFPVNKKAFESRGMQIIENPKNETISIKGDEYELSSLSIQEYNRLNNYISTINNKLDTNDYDINKIINEEVLSMINGEKTPEETALMIQNRVSIMISEKY